MVKLITELAEFQKTSNLFYRAWRWNSTHSRLRHEATLRRRMNFPYHRVGCRMPCAEDLVVSKIKSLFHTMNQAPYV